MSTVYTTDNVHARVDESCMVCRCLRPVYRRRKEDHLSASPSTSTGTYYEHAGARMDGSLSVDRDGRVSVCMYVCIHVCVYHVYAAGRDAGVVMSESIVVFVDMMITRGWWVDDLIGR